MADPQIGALMERVGKEVEFQDGFRVTDADTIDLVRMVLVGKVNRDIVSSINVHGALAVGLSGEDANLITATARSEALGYVGDVVHVDPVIVHQLLAQGLIPVVATIGTDQSGQAFNINADTAAGALAAALEAEKLVFLTDVSGLRAVPDDPSTLIHQATAEDLDSWWPSGAATGGMIPKVEACARAVRSGVRPRPHPRRPHAARPAARGLHRRRGGHHGGGGAMTGRDPATGPPRPTPRGAGRGPLRAHAQLRRAAGDLRARRGSRAVRHRGRPYLDFLSGTGRDLAGPRPSRSWPRPSPTQARTLSHVSNLFGNTVGPEVAVTLDRLIGGGTERAGGPGLLRQLGGGGQRVCPQAGPPVGRPGPVRGGQHLGRLPRADPGHPGRHRPAREAAAFLPLPEGFDHVPFDDLDAMDAACDPARVAAVLVEPILGEAGVVVPSSDYLVGLRQLCTDRDILLMVDEVQTGLGRTGRWFGFQHLGVEPDVVTMAKALGNGMPVGACWARAEVAAAFVPGDHGSTFGGQPLAMSAARATLAVMEAEDVPARARRPGPGCGPGWRRSPGWTAVRGEGLLLAAVLDGAVRRARPAARRSTPVWSSTRRGPTSCGSPRRCWSRTRRSTGRWPWWVRSWPAGRPRVRTGADP